ncbi:MAG: cellulase family glycosylhydrolase [Terracidiphilus sp.]
MHWPSPNPCRSFSSHLPRLSVPIRAALAALAILCIGAGAAAQPAFPLHTSGASIVDSSGKVIHLNAFNWFGAESTDYVVEGLQAQPLSSIVATIKGLGFNAVRLLFSNQMVETNPVVGNYALTANPSMDGENALTIYDQVVSALSNAGIMVILDNHMSNAGWCCSTSDHNELWYNSDYPQANWVADWKTMAQRYASNPWVIGADLRNEPRSPATWGGNPLDDWHAAAELGGNAVLSVNPNLLIFVEGVDYAGDLSCVASLPVQLNVANQLVYEAHDYGFWYSGLTSYSDWYNKIEPKWGYLVTGSSPQPLWIGEFGTCNTADTCVNSDNSGDLGYWFNAMTSFVRDYGVNWSYWTINGTTESGNGGGFGTVENYGVLNTSWNASALPSLTARLQSMMAATASPNFNLITSGSAMTVAPGGSIGSAVTIVPENGFTGTVSLSCAVSVGSGSAADPPTCIVVNPSVSLSGNATGTATVSVATTGSTASILPGSGTRDPSRRLGGIALGCVLLFFGGLSRRRRALLLMLVAIAVVFPLAGCGSGGGGSGSGGSGGGSSTTAGGYTVTVTGTASGVSPVTAQIALTVQ